MRYIAFALLLAASMDDWAAFIGVVLGAVLIYGAIAVAALLCLYVATRVVRRAWKGTTRSS